MDRLKDEKAICYVGFDMYLHSNMDRLKVIQLYYTLLTNINIYIPIWID